MSRKLEVYLKRFWDIPIMEKKLIFLSLLNIFIIKMIVGLLPLKYYIFLLESKPNVIAPYLEQYKRIRLMRMTIQRVLKIKMIKLSCLEKSILGKLLLNSLGIKSNIVFCAKMEFLKLSAHAYLEIDSENTFLFNKSFIKLYSLS